MKTLCLATTSKGRRCRFDATGDHGYCGIHAPACSGCPRPAWTDGLCLFCKGSSSTQRRADNNTPPRGHLFLIRGCPGAGKSTTVKALLDLGLDAVAIEADQYFVGEDGTYAYDRSRQNDAHIWCRAQCKEALERGQSVVVANTFVRMSELDPYKEMATEHSYRVYEILIPNHHGGSNIHGVPTETVNRMRDEIIDNWKP